MTRKTRNYQGRDFNKKRGPDRISEKRRSYVMSTVKSKGTKFETDFIALLNSKTAKSFECNVREIKGKPDIVFMISKVCVFLDSDFWHGWQYPRWKHLLKNDFWRDKIEKNRVRDKRTTALLRRRGWKVMRVWEHNIKKDAENEISKILELVESD